MPVDPHSHVPIYEQIIEHIHGRIATGVYQPDEPLPSIRALALELLVNPNTVQRAYQELERQGLVYMRKGLGVFVASNGRTTARSKSEEAVRERFSQGIDLGRSARLAEQTLRSLFNRTLRERPSPPQGHDRSSSDKRASS
ncbi:MAG: GntR family transcriptional regulator [Phycisphaerae bacterium]|nr:GntR family transcriptional regulator [Phycisphaerae bacterium]